ncbi:MAG: hydroxyacid dehydrogenase [Candidatus Methylacidiphilales bacterium]|nr:hydroxyacid dehydrogenase [Candidatus Methylacidiphilales bacterium]
MTTDHKINGAGPRPSVYIHRVGPAYYRYMDRENESALSAFADVVSDGPTEAVRSPEDLAARMRGCSAILSLAGGWTDEITAGVLKSAGTIRHICIAHWGGQLVDAAKEAGIPVTEGSNANTVAVAEWTLTSALMGIRRLHIFDKMLRSGSPWGTPVDAGLLCETTVGLIGLGRIGSRCAHYFNALGARVIAYDPYCPQDRAVQMNIALVPLHELLATAVVISIHLPVTPETTGMLGAQEFSLIRDGAVFINSARSAFYNEDVLLAELKKERFSAYLDVFSQEPLPAIHPLCQLRNVILTPHIAGNNAPMYLRCGREAIETLRACFAGEGLRNLQYA